MWDKMGVPGLANQNQLRVVIPCEERYNLKKNLLGEAVEPHPRNVVWLSTKEGRVGECWQWYEKKDRQSRKRRADECKLGCLNPVETG